MAAGANIERKGETARQQVGEVSQLPAGDSLVALATWKASQLASLFAARPSTRHFMKEQYRHLTVRPKL